MKTHEVLNKAADLIKEKGWAQHALQNESGGMCALGALSMARNGSAYVPHGLGEAWSAITSHVGPPFRGVSGWNNAPERTASEVVEVLRACALIEEAREEAALAQTEAQFEEFAHAVPASRP